MSSSGGPLSIRVDSVQPASFYSHGAGFVHYVVLDSAGAPGISWKERDYEDPSLLVSLSNGVVFGPCSEMLAKVEAVMADPAFMKEVEKSASSKEARKADEKVREAMNGPQSAASLSEAVCATFELMVVMMKDPSALKYMVESPAVRAFEEQFEVFLDGTPHMKGQVRRLEEQMKRMWN